ncbi:tight adherence protein B [Clostridiales Family XIII bacterium PM5-7]
MISDYGVYRLSKKERAVALSVSIVAVACIGYLFYESLFPLVILPFLYGRIEKEYGKRLAYKRQEQLRLQFKDLLYSLSASFATGRHLSEALLEAKESLSTIYRQGEHILLEIEQMLMRMKELRETDLQVLEDFAARSNSEDIENFTEVFRACRDTGGDLVEGVNKAATIIGDKILIETEIKTMIAQKKLEGRIITFMPIGIICFLRMMSADYLEVMYTTVIGRILMTVAIGATVLAYVMIERITNIEV